MNENGKMIVDIPRGVLMSSNYFNSMTLGVALGFYEVGLQPTLHRWKYIVNVKIIIKTPLKLSVDEYSLS